MGNKIYDELQTLTVPLYANRTMEHTAYGWGFFNNINPEKYWGKKVHFYIYICVTFKTMSHSSFKQLNGPNLNRLLEKSLDLHKFLPTELKKFANCLRLLKEMMEACYGVVLEDHWEMKIDRFRMEYMNLGLEMTPKFHCKQKHN